MFSKRTLFGTSLVIALSMLGIAAAVPSLAQAPPIAVELLTPRSVITDDVSGQIRFKHHDGATEVINKINDLSRTAVARITVQPGAQFPWHTHPGPVIANVAEGELVYVGAEDCTEVAYAAGEAFLDTGHGHVHTAFNRLTTPTVLYATFLQVPASGPLTITEGITAPADCQITP